MTAQYFSIDGLPTGLSPTVKAFDTDSPDTEVTGNTFSVSEGENAKGRYTITVTRSAVLPAGDYDFRLFLGAVPLAVATRRFAGTDGETGTAIPTAVELDSATIQAIADAVGSSGSGARTVTITVNDGTTVLQNATIRLTEGANTFTAQTNVSGVAVFNLDDATYTVAITKSGYSYAGTTLVVDGTETRTYSMTAISITPGSENLTTGWLVTRVNGIATASVTVSYQMAEVPVSGTGSSYDGTVYTATSADDGVAELSLVKGAKYWVWRGTVRRPEETEAVLIPSGAGATYELPSHLG